MSKLVEDTVRALRESPLYRDNEFVQSEGFESFVRSLVTQTENWMPELVQSILNRYFALQRKEEAAKTYQSMLTARMPSPRPTVEDLLEDYKERLATLLADRYAEKQFIEKERLSPGNWRPSAQSEQHSGEDTIKDSRDIEKKLSDLKVEFRTIKDVDKEVRRTFPFLTDCAFADALNKISARDENPDFLAEKTYRLFDTLTGLSLLKSGETSLTEARNLSSINGRLEKYKENRDAFSGDGTKHVKKYYKEARSHLIAASKKLKLPDDYVIRILDAIADNEEFRMAVHILGGIAKYEDFVGQLFRRELKLGGRAGGSEATPGSDSNALNAIAVRALNVDLPEDIENKSETIYRLMKSMGFDVTKASVQRNFRRASVEGGDQGQTEDERVAEQGSLFQLGTDERVEKHLSEMLNAVRNRD